MVDVHGVTDLGLATLDLLDASCDGFALSIVTLLQHARGTITINSTVGLSSLHHGTPVKTLGYAIYDMPGLAHEGSLADFLQHPGSVDLELYDAFRHYLLAHNQANGSVWRRLPGRRFGTGIRWFERGAR
jgi:capsule polysaccharide modification protein KpsS